MFKLIKKFWGANRGIQLHIDGIGGPRGNPFGTAMHVRSYPSVFKWPDWIVPPPYGAAATNWAPKPGPSIVNGVQVINSINKPQTGSDMSF